MSLLNKRERRALQLATRGDPWVPEGSWVAVVNDLVVKKMLTSNAKGEAVATAEGLVELENFEAALQEHKG